jgi:hypothetical protein
MEILQQSEKPQILRFPINFDTAPLWHVVDGENANLSVDHPRRVLQQPDSATADYLFHQFGEQGPPPTTVQELWQRLGVRKSFHTTPWEKVSQYFGTNEMYTNPDQKNSIHGNGHQDRVTVYAYLLGQYRKLNASDMKVLLVAASIHDRARTNDMMDTDHGLKSAINFDTGKNYLATYLARGITFTPSEIQAIKTLCIYHEKSWGIVPTTYKDDPRMKRLIQTIHAADAADRYRSPNPNPNVGWWPKPKYFLEFFDNDSEKVTHFLNFAAYFTLSSEKERFGNNLSVEEAIQHKSLEMGIIKKGHPTSLLRRLRHYYL